MEHRRDDGIRENFFQYTGRLNRLRYLNRIAVIVVVNLLLAGMIKLFEEMSIAVENAYLSILVGIFGIVTVVFAVISVVSSIMLKIRRLHDIEASGWWALLSFIPLVNLIFGIFLLLKEGTEGSNKYGNDPLQSINSQSQETPTIIVPPREKALIVDGKKWGMFYWAWG